MALGPAFDAIIASARGGDRAAITALYGDLGPRLHRYVRARAPQDADDLNSEIWLTLARHLPSFEGNERQWWAFAFTVARRQLSDHWKRQRRRMTDPVAPETLGDLPARTDTEAVMLEHLSSDEAAAFVTANLSPEQAEVVLLRVLGDLDVDVVAGMLHKRPGTIRVIQHRALRRLAALVSTMPVIA